MNRSHALFTWIVLAFMTIATPVLSFAKEKVPLGASAKAFKISRSPVKSSTLPSPLFGGNTDQRRFTPKDWIALEVNNIKFDVANPKHRSLLGIGKEENYFGPLMVSFFVLVPDPTGSSKQILIRKDVTYTDIPLNEATNLSVYFTPVTIDRLKMKGKKFEMIGYEISYNDDVIYRYTNKPLDGYTDWWNISSPSVIKQPGKYALLDKSQTPFSNCWSDSYPTILSVDSTSLKRMGSNLSTLNKELDDMSEDNENTPEAKPEPDNKKPAPRRRPSRRED